MKDISASDIKNNLPLITKEEETRLITAKDVVIGGEKLAIMAGPCAVESRPQIFEAAKAVRESGGHLLRGGVFKPLTFPYGDPLGQPDRDAEQKANDRMRVLSKQEAFQAAEKRFAYFKEAGEKYNLPIVSEVLYSDSVPMMSKYVDVFQVGYRHMFNVDLIDALCNTEKPVLIKRHYGESLRSLLGVGEHFEARGKHNIMFCERGVSVPHTHNTESRAILDIQAIPALKEYAPSVPVIADPSHSTFKRRYVIAMSRAAIAAGADGLLIDVHPTPETAWVDPLQALNYKDFLAMMREVEAIAKVLNRSV